MGRWNASHYCCMKAFTLRQQTHVRPQQFGSNSPRKNGPLARRSHSFHFSKGCQLFLSSLSISLAGRQETPTKRVRKSVDSAGPAWACFLQEKDQNIVRLRVQQCSFTARPRSTNRRPLARVRLPARANGHVCNNHCNVYTRILL